MNNASDDANDPFAPPEPGEVTPRKGYTYDPLQPIPEHMQRAPEPKYRGPREVDSSETAFRLKTFTWSVAGGIIFGLGAGLFFGTRKSALMIPAALIGLIGGWFITFVIVRRVTEGAGAGAGSLFFPSGSSTPGDRQYSLAQSYVARGMYDRAAAEYEACSVKYADDPEPCMRLARLYRDELSRYEDAIKWFKRASAVPNVPPGTDMMAMREMIEVYTHRLRSPIAAAPHLARLAAKHPGTPAGDWAKQELAAMKAEMRTGAE